MELVDGDLTLRPPVDEDASAIVRAIEASLDELSPWMPWATPDYDLDMALSWIRGELGDVHRFVMVAEREIVGACSLNGISALNRSANLGYWVRSDQVGRGFATAATRLVRHHGHRVAGLHRIEVAMSVRNEASRRVAEKAGAHYEGRLRGALLLQGQFHDAHLWSFLPD